MYKREDFKIRSEHRGYFIYISNNFWNFLTKNNTIKTWNDLLNDNSISGAEGLIFFNTRQKAEKALDNFLKEQNMNLEAKREQCIADIEVLQSNLANIDREITKSKGPLNKIKEYIDKNWCYGYKPTIKNENGRDYVVVKTPVANDQWTFKVWAWVKAFCEKFNKEGYVCYPIHGYEFQDKNVWIKVRYYGTI